MSEKQEQGAAAVVVIGTDAGLRAAALAALSAAQIAAIDGGNANEEIETLTEELASIRARFESNETLLVSLREEHSTMKRQLAAQKSATTKAKALAAERDPDAKARSLPAPTKRPEIARDDRAALLALLDGTEKIEIVAFQDDREALAVPPLELTGGASALRQVSDGLCLADGSWMVLGDGKSTVTSWGLYANGELVAWRKRGRGALALAAGVTSNLAHDVIF